MSKERIQKILSQAGLGSRRAMEAWIEQGLVKVNGVVAKLGESAGPEDKIVVNNKPIRNPLEAVEKIKILIYHKPIGEICSRSDPDHPQTVFDKIPPIKNGRWVMVGRLDINTSGLLIFTNSGELANQLMHPKFGLEREYAVRVHGQVSDEVLKNLRKGVQLEDGMAKFQRVEFQGGEGTNTWYHVILTEGKNREVRRLWESQNVEVSRLIRIRYGQFELPRSLSRGHFLELPPKEVDAYLALYLPDYVAPVIESPKSRNSSSNSARSPRVSGTSRATSSRSASSSRSTASSSRAASTPGSPKPRKPVARTRRQD